MAPGGESWLGSEGCCKGSLVGSCSVLTGTMVGDARVYGEGGCGRLS